MGKTIRAVFIVVFIFALAAGGASAQQLSGKWLVNANGYTFLMTLSQSGGSITGTWKPLNHGDSEVKIKGSASGSTISFKRGLPDKEGFEGAQEYKGQVFQVGGVSKMKGTFIHHGTGGYAWCATPLSSAKVKDLKQWSDCKLDAPCGDPRGPVGTWTTSEGTMHFPETAKRNIRAPYDADDGRIIGTLDTGTRTLSGIWVEYGSNERCETAQDGSYHWGKVMFKFDKDYRNFAGKWTYCEKDFTSGDSVEWSGNVNCTQPVEVEAPKAKVKLPPKDIIEAKGMMADMPDEKPDEDCSCDTVQLAKVKTQKFVRKEGWGILTPKKTIYNNYTHYDASTGDASIVMPELVHRDIMCFYFTYPEGFAYLSQEGAPHPCRAVVELTYPHTRSASGEYVDTWQLYSIRGLGDFRTASKNNVCRVVSSEFYKIPAGKGKVRWSVEGQVCGEKEFTIDATWKPPVSSTKKSTGQ